MNPLMNLPVSTCLSLDWLLSIGLSKPLLIVPGPHTGGRDRNEFCGLSATNGLRQCKASLWVTYIHTQIHTHTHTLTYTHNQARHVLYHLLLPRPITHSIFLMARYEGGIRVPGILEWPAVIKQHSETWHPACECCNVLTPV